MPNSVVWPFVGGQRQAQVVRHPPASAPRQLLLALVIAPAARAWIAASRSARVLHVFARACNLVNERDDVISLVAHRHGMGPFAVHVAGVADFAAQIDARSQVVIEGLTLAVGPISIHTRHAARWEPRPPWERLRTRLADLQSWLAEICRLLDDHAPGDSMGAGAWGDTYSVMQQLHVGLRTDDVPALRTAAHALAGLGPGLTPAGDDFLVGVMYGLWATRAPREGRRLAETITSAAAPRTNHLSRAWLWAAARGEANAHWHALVRALADGTDDLRPDVLRIMNTGHTSGADALAGFVLATANAVGRLPLTLTWFSHTLRQRQPALEAPAWGHADARHP